MRIAVIGSGYVGLVTGACFADIGHEVICADVDGAKIDRLRKGDIPIYEPGLVTLVEAGARKGRLSFTTDTADAVRTAEVVFIAVGTPSRSNDGHADLAYVYAAARDIARAADTFKVVAIKSTVPVGTGDEVERILRDANPRIEIPVASNPEFLREGAAIDDFMHPDRIVVGTGNARARQMLTDIYRPLVSDESPMLVVSRRTSELIKYASNSFLAMKVAFINEAADLCEALDADVEDVARGMGLDDRIGAKFLQAGPGYGGSCFPKDILALVKTGRENGNPMRLVETTLSANEDRRRKMVRKIAAACGGTVRGKTIAVLGLTFKANTDDVRESPSLAIIRELQDLGAVVRAYDPQGMEGAASVLENVSFGTDAYDAAKGAQAVVIATGWDEFRALDFARLATVVAARVMVDLRNLYAPNEVGAQGFSYTSVGRPGVMVDSKLAQAAE